MCITSHDQRALFITNCATHWQSQTAAKFLGSLLSLLDAVVLNNAPGRESEQIGGTLGRVRKWHKMRHALSESDLYIGSRAVPFRFPAPILESCVLSSAALPLLPFLPVPLQRLFSLHQQNRTSGQWLLSFCSLPLSPVPLFSLWELATDAFPPVCGHL